jgi:hypothetical protein
MSHRSRDIDVADDQYAKTVVLDPNGSAKVNDEEATVVLDLTPAEVHDLLAVGTTPVGSKKSG